MVMDFTVRFEEVRQARGPLAWGLDPSGDLLEAWGVSDDATGLERFVDIVLPIAADTVGLIKPQAAFYERHGWQGIRAMARLVAEARDAGLLVVLDAKRGDVGSTNQAYAEAYIGLDAPIAADAVTVHPYLGFDAMGPFVERAVESGACLLIVTRSSNPEGRAIQACRDGNGRLVEQSLLDGIGELNAQLAPGRCRHRSDSARAAPRPRLAERALPRPRRRPSGRHSPRRCRRVRRLSRPGVPERLALATWRTGPCSAARRRPSSRRAVQDSAPHLTGRAPSRTQRVGCWLRTRLRRVR